MPPFRGTSIQSFPSFDFELLEDNATILKKLDQNTLRLDGKSSDDSTLKLKKRLRRSVSVPSVSTLRERSLHVKASNQFNNQLGEALVVPKIARPIAEPRRGKNHTPTIGLFDSGVGGLTVLKEVQKLLPNANYVYFADMARQPYGPRKQEEIAAFSQQILTWLQKQGCDIGIIACNTATCATYDHKVESGPELTLDIYGTIPYAAKAARALGKRVGVIATAGTVSAKAYSRTLGEDIETIEMPCPDFMQIAEEGKTHDPETRRKAQEYLGPALGGKIDTLIYGCTHYPLLKDVVEEVMNSGSPNSSVTFVDPATVVAEAVKLKVDATWSSQQQQTTRPNNSEVVRPHTRFCVNAAPDNFKERAARIMEFSPSVEEVSLPYTPMLRDFYTSNLNM